MALDTGAPYELPYPEDTDVPDGPGQIQALAEQVHAKLAAIDAALIARVPPGVVFYTAAADAPAGYLALAPDPGDVSRSAYADLFAEIGVQHGSGDGSTTFGLPNVERKFILGADAEFSVGEEGGEEDVTLTTAQLPSHTHGDGSLAAASAGGHTHSVGTLAVESGGAHSHGDGTLSTDSHGGHSHGDGSLGTSTHGGHKHNSAIVNVVTDHSGSSDVLLGPASIYGGGPLDTNTAGAHSHDVTGSTASGGSHSHDVTGSTSSAGAHTHSLTGATASNGNHSHDVTGATSATGSGNSHTNMPPWIALLPIIKT